MSNITITGKKVEAETYLPYTSFDGTEIVRIKKRVGGEWLNFYTKFSDLLAWTLINGAQVEKIKISAADTAAGTYTTPRLVGLNETTDFCLFTDNGSGTLVDLTDGINAYDSPTGTLTIPQDKYVLLIFIQP